MKLYKIGVPNLPSSCMPAGMKAEDHSLKLVPIQPGFQILNKLFSISTANTIDDDVVGSNVAGEKRMVGVGADGV